MGKSRAVLPKFACPQAAWKPVPNPRAARYAWQSNPLATLFNGAGLPAVPLRTGDWPGVTAGKTVY
jgi:sialate O-acetylesterase